MPVKEVMIIEEFLARISQVVSTPAPLHIPSFQGNEWKYVKQCLDTGWVSSVGKFVDALEEKICEFTGAQNAVCVVNGTAALHMALLLTGVERGDEVLCPALSFVATANAISYCGAIPHFIDSDEKTLGLCPTKLGFRLGEIAVVRGNECFNKLSGRRIRALIGVHTFGHPIDLPAISETCQEWKISFIEDAAESLGSFYGGQHTGTFAQFAALSFNGNKIVTTGGGGAILIRSCEKAKIAKHLTTTAKLAHPWLFEHDQIGFNYRMPNLNAALGCAQFEELPKFIERKRTLAGRYEKAFEGMTGARFFKETPFAKSNYWLNVLLLERPDIPLRDELLTLAHERGWMVRPAWNLLSTLPMYRECPKMELSTAENLFARLINLPSSTFL